MINRSAHWVVAQSQGVSESVALDGTHILVILPALVGNPLSRAELPGSFIDEFDLENPTFRVQESPWLVCNTIVSTGDFSINQMGLGALG